MAVADKDAYPDLAVFAASAENELRTLAAALDPMRTVKSVRLELGSEG